MSTSKKSAFGIIGLGVMGKSLARNLAGKHFRLSLYNRHEAGVEENVATTFISQHEVLKDARGVDDLHAFVHSLEQPRKVLLMVKAGEATDAVLGELKVLLDEGDIVIDGGNAHYRDTERRIRELGEVGIGFIGCGISGGEEGALKGPSVMPGGQRAAYDIVAPFLTAMAAKDKNGQPCCTYIGRWGAGHFVKMVHNGIEYAEMQLLAELYSILRFGMGKTPDQVADILESWNDPTLGSYLLEITIDILQKRENEDWLIDKILDQAGNKGTGNWTTVAAAELGVPATMISSALFARYVSAFKEERVQAAGVYRLHDQKGYIPISEAPLKKAYRLARLINHHQGFHLLQAASEVYDWQLDPAEIARTWTNGCIIRSALMEKLTDLLKQPVPLLLHPSITGIVKANRKSLITTVGRAAAFGLPVPCFSAALHYLHGYAQEWSAANLIQAQRDYFGAHTYKRVDDAEGKDHHTGWNEN